MRIGYYFGIPLKVNPFFILLLAAAFAWGRLIEALLLFGIVLWHESAHILMAKVYRLYVTDIELLPFGGVTRLESLLQLNPGIEWRVAMAGPVSNGVLIFLAYGLRPYFAVEPYWFDFFLQANVGMALFNLLPGLPLDGGRILRGLLVRRKGFNEATQVAAILGQILSLILAGLGIYVLSLGKLQGLVSVLAAAMLFLSAKQEQKSATYIFMRYLTHKRQEIRRKRVVAARELVATVESSLGEVLQHIQPPYYHLIWIMDIEGRLVGFLGEVELIAALFEHGFTHKLGAVPVHKI